MRLDEKEAPGSSRVQESEQSHVDKVEATHVDEVESSANDLEKQGEVKGDGSEGHVEWTWRQIFATLSLCGLYAGACALLARLQGRHNRVSSLSFSLTNYAL